MLAVLGLSACLGPEPSAPLTVRPPVYQNVAIARPSGGEASVSDRAKTCTPVEPLDVLFIGNSYVIQSDTPGLLQSMADDAGVDFHVERLATGGKNFEYHLERSKTKTVLREQHWDVVILQSHSLDPLRNPDGFAEAGEALVGAVRSVGAQPWLFETWARRKGHNLYNYMKEVGKTPDEMQARVSARYAALGEETGTPVAKVGTAWLELVHDHTEVNPFLKDGAHPAEAGAYLSAAVLFSYLTERDPRGVVLPHGAVDGPTAKVLAEVAADVVDPPCTW